MFLDAILLLRKNNAYQFCLMNKHNNRKQEIYYANLQPGFTGKTQTSNKEDFIEIKTYRDDSSNAIPIHVFDFYKFFITCNYYCLQHNNYKLVS